MPCSNLALGEMSDLAPVWGTFFAGPVWTERASPGLPGPLTLVFGMLPFRRYIRPGIVTATAAICLG